MDVALNQMRLITHLLVQLSASFSFHLIVLLYSAPPHTHTHCMYKLSYMKHFQQSLCDKPFVCFSKCS